MDSINLSISNNQISLDYNEHFKNVALIAKSFKKGIEDNYSKLNCFYLDVPQIVGITGACENVDTLFKVKSRVEVPLFFSQTGQLSLEQALQVFNNVWTIIHSGRDEETEDARHLRQFRLTEEEFNCVSVGMKKSEYDEELMFKHLLNHIQSAVQSVFLEVLKNNSELLTKVYSRDINELDFVSKTNFLQIEYTEAVDLLSKNGFSNLKWGDDLKSDHEAKVVDLLNSGNKYKLPVFITKYPEHIKFFNMKESIANPKVVMSCDLILPYSGESTGAAVREHNFDKLNDRLLRSTMYRLHKERGGTYEDFLWYLNIMKQEQTNPHAGYGIGNERVMQYIFGEKDIRNVAMFSLLAKQTKDWVYKN